MTRGDTRREANLANFEAEFHEALAEARKLKFSAFISEKQNRRRGAATPLDVKLFTLESKIQRLREKVGLEPLVIDVPKAEGSAPRLGPWDPAPALDDALFAVDPAELWAKLDESGRDPSALFHRVKCASAKSRQSPGQGSWRLATIEVGDGRVPAKLTLTLMPLPAGPDADDAVKKFDDALGKLVSWSERAIATVSEERPRLLHLYYTRASRELQFAAR